MLSLARPPSRPPAFTFSHLTDTQTRASHLGTRCWRSPQACRSAQGRALCLPQQSIISFSTDAVPIRFSVAFDPDLQRHITSEGVIAFTRNDLMGVTTVFFDPLCEDSALPEVLDGFFDAVHTEHPHDRIAFWKVSRAVANVLSDRGYQLAPYGIENDVCLPRALGGTQLRGLRRQVDAARRRGVVVQVVEASADAADWADLRAVTDRWLKTRPQPFEVKRVTRRTPHASEEHCTKLVARLPDGSAVGWAAFDHMYCRGELIGCGMNAVRYDPASCPGVAALLAQDGAALVQQKLAARIGGKSHTTFRLALGESPLPSSEALDGFENVHRSSRFLEQIFHLVRERGRWLYGVQGISDWKRKWRADREVTYCALPSGSVPPLREALAVTSSLFL